MTIWGPGEATGSQTIWLPPDELRVMAAYWPRHSRANRLLPSNTSTRPTALLRHPNDHAQGSMPLAGDIERPLPTVADSIGGGLGAGGA